MLLCATRSTLIHCDYVALALLSTLLRQWSKTSTHASLNAALFFTKKGNVQRSLCLKKTPSTPSCLHRMHSNTEPSCNRAFLNENVHFCLPAERHASLSTAISLPKVLLDLHASSNAERSPEKARGLDVLACSFALLFGHKIHDSTGRRLYFLTAY